jgi:integrase
MKGHTRKRLGKDGQLISWAYVVDIGLDDSGKRKQKWVSGFATERAANKAMREALGQLEKGRNPFPSNDTVATYTREWLASHAVRPRTKLRYEQLLEKHILPKVGWRRLGDLTSAHLRVVWSEMSKTVAPATVRQARAVLGAALNTAVNDGILDRNPVAQAKAPKVPRPTLTVLRPEHVRALLVAVDGTPYAMPITLAAMTGLRRSEVLALAWDNVDLDQGTLRVVRGLHVRPKISGDDDRDAAARFEFQEPKSNTSKRTIRLAATLVEALRRHRLEQMQRRLALPTWRDLGLVVDRGDGVPLHPDIFSAAFRRYAKAAELPKGARLHDLRHACAVMMRLEDVPIVAVAEYLGHHSAGFTLSVYEHVLDEMRDAAPEAMERRLGG